MAIIKTIQLIGNKQKLLTSSEHDHCPSLDELLIFISSHIKWRHFMIIFSDNGSLRAVLNDDSLNECWKNENGEISFFVFPGDRFFANELNLLVAEGFQLNPTMRLLKKFNGDVQMVRETVRVNDVVAGLFREGFKPKSKCKKVLTMCNGDVEMFRREFENVEVKKRGREKKREKKEKKEVTDEMIEERKAKKEARNEKKLESKEGRRAKRRARKVQRLEDDKKSSSVDPVKNFVLLSETQISLNGEVYEIENAGDFFADNFSKIYLDGNNMLFIENQIRALVLQKSKRTTGEQILANIASHFTRSINLRNAGFQTVLMFDASNLHGITDQNIQVVSGREIGFGIADDALVSIASALQETDKILFVTSDRELQNRLHDLGMYVIKSGTFMKCAKRVIGEDTYSGILHQNIHADYE